MKSKILMSGITSFTGAHIARALRNADHKVLGTLTQQSSVYENNPLLSKRMSFSRVTNWATNFAVASADSLKQIEEFKPQIWLGHGAPIKGYRSPDFDFLSSLDQTISGLKDALAVFKSYGGELYVHSGTVFEADEGVGETPGLSGVSEAVSAYGMSKNLVWNAIRFFCAQIDLPVLKVVIPNPIGRYENEDRLMPLFSAKWKKGEIPEMRAAHLVRDQLPVEWLAQVYLKAIESFKGSGEKSFSVKIKRPSGFVMTNHKFIELCQKEFKNRVPGLRFDCRFESIQTREPLERFNSEPVPELRDTDARKVFFDEWTDSLFSNC
jgi:nucleoside-diphosphate-sugar epimerase